MVQVQLQADLMANTSTHIVRRRVTIIAMHVCIAIVLYSTTEPMSHVWYELGAGKVRIC